MSLPFFYIYEHDETSKQIVLNEETSKHIIQVLRMKVGEKLNLTDGKGNLMTAEITDAHKKHCEVKVEDTRHKEQDIRQVSIAISLLKNTNRFEWFLEKATEIGVSEIIPLICERTEKEKFRYERMNSILISAMLQSQQPWLPILHEPQEFNQTIRQSNHQQKFIAHCSEGEKSQLTNKQINGSTIILIGPEGDFTKQEIDLAFQNNFIPVSLGNTRLRSETAGIVAAVLHINL
jgi:16S rRNA (uracil1498-N3)-methyltransferase